MVFDNALSENSLCTNKTNLSHLINSRGVEGEWSGVVMLKKHKLMPHIEATRAQRPSARPGPCSTDHTAFAARTTRPLQHGPHAPLAMSTRPSNNDHTAPVTRTTRTLQHGPHAPLAMTTRPSSNDHTAPVARTTRPLQHGPHAPLAMTTRPL